MNWHDPMIKRINAKDKILLELVFADTDKNISRNICNVRLDEEWEACKKALLKIIRAVESSYRKKRKDIVTANSRR